MASLKKRRLSDVGCDGHPPTDLTLQVVTPDGGLYGTFSAPCAEMVEQFIKRFGLEQEEASGLVITLLHGHQHLLREQSLQDCGVSSGATLTLLRERQSQLQLVAFGAEDGYNAGGAFFSWVVEDDSAAAQLGSGAVAWSSEYAATAGNDALTAICSLQNPQWIQCRVDNGELSKSAAVMAVLTSFIRCLLATGRLGDAGDGECANVHRDHEAGTIVLREHLPQTTRGVNLLSGSESQANLSEIFLEYLAENTEYFSDSEKVVEERERVKLNLACPFRLDACEEPPENFLTSPQEYWQHRDKYTRSCSCSGSSRWWWGDSSCKSSFLQRCDHCHKEDWISFRKSVIDSDSVWFHINSDLPNGTFFESSAEKLQVAVGVYLEREARGPSTLPSHYVVQWARETPD